MASKEERVSISVSLSWFFASCRKQLISCRRCYDNFFIFILFTIFMLTSSIGVNGVLMTRTNFRGNIRTVNRDINNVTELKQWTFSKSSLIPAMEHWAFFNIFENLFHLIKAEILSGSEVEKLSESE